MKARHFGIHSDEQAAEIQARYDEDMAWTARQWKATEPAKPPETGPKPNHRSTLRLKDNGPS